MLALAELDAQTCSGCGGWLPDTLTMDDADRLFEATFVGMCAGCYAFDIAGKAADDDGHQHARRYSLKRAAPLE